MTTPTSSYTTTDDLTEIAFRSVADVGSSMVSKKLAAIFELVSRER